MGLPRGVFKGLAVVVGPLLLWMGAGWAAYPTLLKSIMDAAGKSLDIREVRMFSGIMLALCIGAGLALTAYGLSGARPQDAEIKAPDSRTRTCRACGTPLPNGAAGRCPVCGRMLS